MEGGEVEGRSTARLEGLGDWASVRSTQWVRVGSGVAAVAYLGHLIVCLATWPMPIGDPIGEAITVVACTVAFFLAPRRPALGAAISCASVAAEVYVAAAIVPTEWVASTPVLPVVVLATGLFFGARAALTASAVGVAIYPLVMLAAGKIGPAAGGVPPHELSRMVVFSGAVSGTGLMTWFALRSFARLHAEAVERRQVETRIQLAQRLQLVGELAGTAAHDFRNIIAVFQNVSTLLGASHDPEYRKLGGELLQTTRSGSALTAQLLDLARRTEPARQVIDFARTVDGTRPMVARLIGGGCSLAMEAHGPAPALVDPGEVEQLVLNLAVNARDAMGAAGRILIRARAVAAEEARALGSTLAGRQVLLEVADQGPGVPAELRERIFEPFVTTKPRGEGTGLGLSTVRSIATGIGGVVTLESAPGLGATFRVFLPEAIAPVALDAR